MADSEHEEEETGEDVTFADLDAVVTGGDDMDSDEDDNQQIVLPPHHWGVSHTLNLNTEQKCQRNEQQFQRFYWVTVQIWKSVNWNKLDLNPWISHDLAELDRPGRA